MSSKFQIICGLVSGASAISAHTGTDVSGEGQQGQSGLPGSTTEQTDDGIPNPKKRSVGFLAVVQEHTNRGIHLKLIGDAKNDAADEFDDAHHEADEQVPAQPVSERYPGIEDELNRWFCVENDKWMHIQSPGDTPKSSEHVKAILKGAMFMVEEDTYKQKTIGNAQFVENLKTIATMMEAKSSRDLSKDGRDEWTAWLILWTEFPKALKLWYHAGEDKWLSKYDPQILSHEMLDNAIGTTELLDRLVASATGLSFAALSAGTQNVLRRQADKLKDVDKLTVYQKKLQNNIETDSVIVEGHAEKNTKAIFGLFGAKQVGMYSAFFKDTVNDVAMRTAPFRFSKWFAIARKIYKAGTSRFAKGNSAFKKMISAYRPKFNTLLEAYRELDESRFCTDTGLFVLTKTIGTMFRSNASTGWSVSRTKGDDPTVIQNRQRLINKFLTAFKDLAGTDKNIWKVFLDAVQAHKVAIGVGITTKIAPSHTVGKTLTGRAQSDPTNTHTAASHRVDKTPTNRSQSDTAITHTAASHTGDETTTSRVLSDIKNTYTAPSHTVDTTPTKRSQSDTTITQTASGHVVDETQTPRSQSDITNTQTASGHTVRKTSMRKALVDITNTGPLKLDFPVASNAVPPGPPDCRGDHQTPTPQQQPSPSASDNGAHSVPGSSEVDATEQDRQLQAQQFTEQSIARVLRNFVHRLGAKTHGSDIAQDGNGTGSVSAGRGPTPAVDVSPDDSTAQRLTKVSDDHPEKKTPAQQDGAIDQVSSSSVDSADSDEDSKSSSPDPSLAVSGDGGNMGHPESSGASCTDDQSKNSSRGIKAASTKKVNRKANLRGRSSGRRKRPRTGSSKTANSEKLGFLSSVKRFGSPHSRRHRRGKEAKKPEDNKKIS